MKKNLFAVACGMSMLLGSIGAISADDTTVSVGVSTATKPAEQISVTVPLTSAVAVYADASTADGTPSVIVGETVSQQKKGALVFTNNAATSSVKISGVRVMNESEDWTLKTTPTAAFEMGLSVNGTAVGDVSKGGSKNVSFADARLITAGNAETLPMNVTVGGKNSEYTAKTDATAYRLVWTIEAAA